MANDTSLIAAKASERGRRSRAAVTTEHAFASLVRCAAGGWEPRLPVNDGFLELASGGQERRWGLYQVLVCDGAKRVVGYERVGRRLRALLSSASTYPPSMVLARADTARRAARICTRRDFAAEYAARLRAHLEAQPSAPYFLAEVLDSADIDLTRNGYVWIVQWRAETDEVLWVSGDYFTYWAPASSFLLDRRRLERLQSQAR